MPALPEILLNLLELYRRDDAQLSEFAELISRDAAMATKLMAVANSAAYRHRGPVGSVERALAVLGTETVKTLVISQSVFQAFYGLPALRDTDLRPFWQHALLAASAARQLARLWDYPREDEAYLAGLLHDIGRLGLLAAAPQDYATAFATEDDAGLCQLEQRLWRVSHAEAGAWLVERWRLDGSLADSVRYHHEPVARLAALHPLLRIVLSADAAAERLRVALSPMMVAATVLNDLPLAGDESALLQRLADAARIVFQFGEVVVMLPDASGRGLRWLGATSAAEIAAALPMQWTEFSLPTQPGTRVGDGLAARQPVFLARDAATPLEIAEDQLLRLLATDQLVAALMAHLRLRRELLAAFLVQAQALRTRAQALQAVGERERAELVARHALGLRDLAHEVNNPLSIIQNYLSLLDVKLAAGGRDASIGQDIGVLQQEVARVGRLVRALAEPAGAPPQAVDVNAAAAAVDIVDHPHPGGAQVLAGRDALRQILVNLVKNAVEALGAIEAGTGRVVVAHNGLVNRDGRLMVEISVRDNGPGMAPETLAGLFTAPTAGEAGRAGRGRGLAIVQGLVHGLGGWVQCRSGVGGTCVDVFLPHRAADPAAPASEP
ncbi:HDOD domain-containing protein [Piscinibacter sakaiensis]|uniref:HDOD domain-containing protein n=1 Tax=Piscinibacter sakaiensis TaxID=1547922 RepID=UPI00372CDD52